MKPLPDRKTCLSHRLSNKCRYSKIKHQRKTRVWMRQWKFSLYIQKDKSYETKRNEMILLLLRLACSVPWRYISKAHTAKNGTTYTHTEIILFIYLFSFHLIKKREWEGKTQVPGCKFPVAIFEILYPLQYRKL